jgi:hypothetical protein
MGSARRRSLMRGCRPHPGFEIELEPSLVGAARQTSASSPCVPPKKHTQLPSLDPAQTVRLFGHPVTRPLRAFYGLRARPHVARARTAQDPPSLEGRARSPGYDPRALAYDGRRRAMRRLNGRRTFEVRNSAARRLLFAVSRVCGLQALQVLHKLPQ